MATIAQWAEGARLRTLPLAIAPVLIGTGAAFGAIGGFSSLIIGSVDPADRPELGIGTLLFRALLAVIVSLGLQIGSNFANDYSDGIRGTDADRVGPFRLTGSGAASPRSVKLAAFSCFGLAALAGLALVVWTGLWWLLLVGVAAILAAWFYTGGRHPYGYAGLGEIMVFVFFGLVAVLGTQLVQVGMATFGRTWPAGLAAACAVGFIACALLVVNNLRDIDGDRRSGKRTLATRLGERGTRVLYQALMGFTAVATVVLAALTSWWALGGLLFLVLALGPMVAIGRGARGLDLIGALKSTGLAELVLGVGMIVGMAIGVA